MVDPFLFLLCDLPIFSAIGNGTISPVATWFGSGFTKQDCPFVIFNANA
uniref:Uncharacterized protein n=1 Tax=Setaria italica TaxID=4555 RepID=K3ZFQ8_SETIT